MDSHGRNRFLREFPEALADDAGALFVGAGVSMEAGYPSWSQLLHEIGEELGVKSSDVHDLAALAQWSIQSTGSATKIRKVIRDNIRPDREVPEALKIVARLPIKHIWTTNYDRLIERSFSDIGRPLDSVSAVSDLALRTRPGTAHLYKMHGSVDRLDDLVISTDDYELYRSKRGAFLPLLQAHLTSMAVLFIGLSFTDPNIRHVLSLIRESFIGAPPEHFAIVRPPQKNDFTSDAEFKAKATQHNLWARDLSRYGLIAIEIEDYSLMPDLLMEVERKLSRRRIWVSGSLSGTFFDKDTAKIFAIAEGVGKAIGTIGLNYVSGFGQLVGSAATSGFLNALRETGSWDLERRMIVRPFPQPLDGKLPDKEQWNNLRSELARLSGTIVVVGGMKGDTRTSTVADGVIQEVRLAEEKGSFILPIGATGGAAQEIAGRLIGSDMRSGGADAGRPTDDELRALNDVTADSNQLIELTTTILKRVTKQ